MKGDKKGFTIIELIISLGILAIVLSLVFTFFMSNQRSMSKIEVKSSLQQEAQIVLDYISKSGMQAGKITSINGISDSNLINQNTSNAPIDSIVFEAYDGNNYSFTLNNTTHELHYSGSGVSDKVIGRYVKGITVSIINGTSSTYYNNCSAVKVKVAFNKNNDSSDYEVAINVYFRNKTNW